MIGKKLKTIFLAGKLGISLLAISQSRKKKIPVVGSLEATRQCNLRCRHCYLFRDDVVVINDISDNKRLQKLRQLQKKYPLLSHMTFVGGEPMLKKSFLREAVKVFPFNWIVTNGTIPIDGVWPKRTAFHVSIDGTKKIHDDIRRTAKKISNDKFSVYERAKQTVNTATAPVYIHTVINKKNMHCLEDLLTEWKQETKAKGFVFSFHTPEKDLSRSSGISKEDEKLFLDGKEKQKVVKDLLRLKELFGNYIVMDKKQIELFLPKNQHLVFGNKCLVPMVDISLDANLDVKKLCVMGNNMDCEKCGCVVPTILYQLKKFDLNVWRYSLGTVVNF